MYCVLVTNLNVVITITRVQCVDLVGHGNNVDIVMCSSGYHQ